jgi:hypothetical protein
VPIRENNNAFWQELAAITHAKPETKPMVNSALTFELNDAMIDERVRKITAQQIARSQNELKFQLESKTQRIQELVEHKFMHNKANMDRIKHELQNQAINQSQSLERSEPKPTKVA